MKVYLLLTDESLSRRNIVLVETEEQAEAIIKNDSYYFSYEEVNVLTDDDVKDIICDERLSTMDNAPLFYETYCNGCDVKYNEDCPYM